MVQDSTGYFIDDPTRPYCFYPIKFHVSQACWVEITWNPLDRCWDVIHPLHLCYQCKIPHPVPPTIEWGPLDGEEDKELQNVGETAIQQATSDTTEDSEELEHSGRSPTPQTQTSTDLVIANLIITAESIHIHKPMATFTVQMIQETVTLPPINPVTRPDIASQTIKLPFTKPLLQTLKTHYQEIDPCVTYTETH